MMQIALILIVFLLGFANETFAALPWAAVNAKDVATAHCKTSSAPSILEIHAYLEAHSSTANLNQAFQKLIPTSFPNTVQAMQGCSNDVTCAMTAIFGKEYGEQLLYLMIRFGLNASEYSSPENSTRFNAQEMQTVMLTIHDLPSFALPFGNNIPFHRFVRGSWLQVNGNNGVIANATIQFFDPWDKEDAMTAQYSVLHELGHRFSGRGIGRERDQQKDWTVLGGWNYEEKAWKHANDGCFISQYAQTKPYEDFAETVSAYRYASQRLLDTCPLKYQYMKENVFQGTEYLSDAQCENVKIRF